MKTKLLIFNVLFLFFIPFFICNGFPTDSLKLHYTFENGIENTIYDATGNGYDGTLVNNAATAKYQGFDIMNLGTENGYLDMGSATGNLIATLDSFTISTYLYIDPVSNITGAGNFAWTFSTNQACSQTSGKYIAYRVNAQRYALSTGGWGNEKVGIQSGVSADKGSWLHVVYTQSETTGTIYINGQAISTGEAAYSPKNNVGATAYNWLGRPHFSNDSYLEGVSYSDFRIYNRALTETEISVFQDNLNTLNHEYYNADVEDAQNILTLDGLEEVRKNLTLPETIGNNVNISWNSSDEKVLTNDGAITRPAVGEEVITLILTATLSKGNITATKEFTVKILPHLNEKDIVVYDSDNIDVNTERAYYLGRIELPYTGVEGSTITWESDNTEYLTNTGNIIKLPAKGEGINTVILTATIVYGSTSVTKDFNIKINENEGYSGYLFAYFTGNSSSDENIFFALSSDGYNYKTLNGGNPVINSDTISNKSGVRDPHILRGHDGKYYMVVTDMKTSQGWNSNHGIVLLKSDDLVTWTHSKIDIKAQYSLFSNIDRAWAPQVFYDEELDKYMVYFSMKTSESSSYDIIYYAYANAGFTDFEDVPKQLFFHPDNKSCIDGDIIYKDGQYHLFFKTEGDGDGLKKAVSDELTGDYILQDKYLQQTTEAVEGSCVFKLIDQDKYILMYDLYTSGKYQFTESTDLANFTLLPRPVSMDFAPRHGTVIPVTAEEAARLAEKWGKSSHVAFGTALSPAAKAINIIKNETTRTVYIPVKYGTDLTNFDPQITGLIPGINVTPEEPQDFTNGAVRYTLSLGSTTKTYDVTVSIDNNPVISTGYYADPEILYSKKTGKFYIYPTSDGYDSWSGYYFKVFSSDDLVNWTDEGVIIDAHTDQVQWANGNTWAPCIIEKKINDEYKYFYYFSAGQDGGSKNIGVAVADHPTGPFTVSVQPLIDYYPSGVTGGQHIDPDVFTDPVSGKSYLYWGNAYLAGAELNDDMVSVNESTITVMTPSDGTFREGIYVIYREGKYYFMWSEDDTNSINYKVRYITGTSPLQKITGNSDVVIMKDNSNLIYGTGHHSVIQIPDQDEWYIVYHRISRPDGINMSKPGNYREICIDKLEFNADGTIKEVVPTLEGISPVRLNQTGLFFQNTQKRELILYPNPVTDMLYIETDAAEEITNAGIFDLSGRIVLSEFLKGKQCSVNCSDLSNGYYVVVAKTEENVYYSKINKK